MELIVRVETPEALMAALDTAVGGVAVALPRRPEADWWEEVRAWRTAAQQRGIRFYLVWDRLVREGEMAEGKDFLQRLVQIEPEALVLRDMGLLREARNSYPHLRLHASGNWGCRNSPGLRLAESLGFSRVVLDGPVSLKDLALMRRQSGLPLEVALPPTCPGFPGLCLLEEYQGIDCAYCSELLTLGENFQNSLMTSLETLSSLSQLGVEAVQVGWKFSSGESLREIVRIFQLVWEAPAADRSRVLAAVQEVAAAFGNRFQEGIPGESAVRPAAQKGPVREAAAHPAPGRLPEGGVWLEARNFQEAAALAREWREPVVVSLTPDNYGAFLPELRRWKPRWLIWRLPPVIPESALTFYQKAMETLKQGGYFRFLAGDWGAMALARQYSGMILGDQTLGVRNSLALDMARELGVTRVCLPPQVETGRRMLKSSPKGSFWGYLYQVPALAVADIRTTPPVPPAPEGETWRWVREDEHLSLCRQTPAELSRGWLETLAEKDVRPLILALPRSGLPWGKAPAWMGNWFKVQSSRFKVKN